MVHSVAQEGSAVPTETEAAAALANYRRGLRYGVFTQPYVDITFPSPKGPSDDEILAAARIIDPAAFSEKHAPVLLDKQEKWLTNKNRRIQKAIRKAEEALSPISEQREAMKSALRPFAALAVAFEGAAEIEMQDAAVGPMRAIRTLFYSDLAAARALVTTTPALPDRPRR